MFSCFNISNIILYDSFFNFRPLYQYIIPIIIKTRSFFTEYNFNYLLTLKLNIYKNLIPSLGKLMIIFNCVKLN